MLFIRKRITFTLFSFFIASLSLFATTNTIEEISQIDGINFAGEEDDFMSADFNIDDLSKLRTFEPEDISFNEKLEMLMLVIKLKTAGYHKELLDHLARHGNEYLIGSACVATMVVAAILKNYTCSKNTAHVA